MKPFFFEATFSNLREKSMTFSPITQKKLPKMVIKTIFPSASGLKKEGGTLFRGGALNTENTVLTEKGKNKNKEKNKEK